MSIEEMRQEIISVYGPVIRRQKVKDMWDGQILRIYTSIQTRKHKKETLRKDYTSGLFYEQTMIDLKSIGG